MENGGREQGQGTVNEKMVERIDLFYCTASISLGAPCPVSLYMRPLAIHAIEKEMQVLPPYHSTSHGSIVRHTQNHESSLARPFHPAVT